MVGKKWICAILLLSTSMAEGARRRKEPPAPPPPPPPPDREFVTEETRDLLLRDMGMLRVGNLRGDVEIQAWAMDKIRIRVVKTVQAPDEASAQALFDSSAVRDRKLGTGEIEIAAEYGKGLELKERLQERRSAKTRMDLFIQAPSRMPVSVLSVGGSIKVTGRAGNTEVRTDAGVILLKGIEAPSIRTVCSSCSVGIIESTGSVSVRTVSGPVLVERVRSPRLFVETETGDQTFRKISGNVALVSKTGNLRVNQLDGALDFTTSEGRVVVDEVRGSLTGHTGTGSISAKVRQWVFQDKAFLETTSGDIDLGLPRAFNAEIEIRTLTGEASTDLPIRRRGRDETLGPNPAHTFIGEVGAGGQQMKVFSKSGNIRVSRIY